MILHHVDTSSATKGSESRVEPDAVQHHYDRTQKWWLGNRQPLVRAHLLGVNVVD